MKLNDRILIGADPELFMRHPDNGQYISAHDRIPGTKWEPHKVPHGAVQVDGTALEFNIDPAHTVDEFVYHISQVVTTLKNMVPGYNVVAEPVAHFDEQYMTFEVPSSALELGCMPDFNGWTKVANPHPEAEGKFFRTAAGHIHIGWCEDADPYDKSHFELCCRVARQMDYYLGIHSLIWDPDDTRRALYGKAGAFRPKSYGVEYRVLSNRWLTSEGLTRWVYNSAIAGMKACFADEWAEAQYGDLAQYIIDNNITNWPERSAINLKVAAVPG